jgi:hypothetical protein
VDRDHDQWQSVAHAVRRRREELGLTQIEATALTAGSGRKISFATWRKVETAVEPPYTRATVAAVCHALGWEPDAFDRILAGDTPRLTTPTGASIEARLQALEQSRGLSGGGRVGLTVEERLARLEALEELRG